MKTEEEEKLPGEEDPNCTEVAGGGANAAGDNEKMYRMVQSEFERARKMLEERSVDRIP